MDLILLLLARADGIKLLLLGFFLREVEIFHHKTGFLNFIFEFSFKICLFMNLIFCHIKAWFLLLSHKVRLVRIPRLVAFIRGNALKGFVQVLLQVLFF